MQEIRCDIFESFDKFELILIPISCYQKKRNGAVPVMSDSLLESFTKQYPSLPEEIGKTIEKFGGCPSIIDSVKTNTRTPTKFATFPIAPPNLRTVNPDEHVFNRLKGRFKPYYLLPGWTLLPRQDMLEFSCIKINEIIRWYKLTKVALPFEGFTFELEDKPCYERVCKMLKKFIIDGLYLIYPEQKTSSQEQITTVQSTVTMEEEDA